MARPSIVDDATLALHSQIDLHQRDERERLLIASWLAAGTEPIPHVPAAPFEPYASTSTSFHHYQPQTSPSLLPHAAQYVYEQLDHEGHEPAFEEQAPPSSPPPPHTITTTKTKAKKKKKTKPPPVIAAEGDETPEVTVSPPPPSTTVDAQQARKASHRQVEARRREGINAGVAALQKIVPGCSKEKGSILQRTAEYIEELRGIQAQMTSEAEAERKNHAWEVLNLTRENDELRMLVCSLQTELAKMRC